MFLDYIMRRLIGWLSMPRDINLSNVLSTISADDWRKEIIDYLKDPSTRVERRVRFQTTKYVLLGEELYYRTIEGVLLKCLGDDEAKSLMGEIHEGVRGAHQSAFKMK